MYDSNQKLINHWLRNHGYQMIFSDTLQHIWNVIEDMESGVELAVDVHPTLEELSLMIGLDRSKEDMLTLVYCCSVYMRRLRIHCWSNNMLIKLWKINIYNLKHPLKSICYSNSKFRLNQEGVTAVHIISIQLIEHVVVRDLPEGTFDDNYEQDFFHGRISHLILFGPLWKHLFPFWWPVLILDLDVHWMIFESTTLQH